MSRKLVLFDIDGTLITRCRLHEESFSVAFRKVLGIDDVDVSRGGHTGKTDKGIIIDVMVEKGVDRRTIH